MKLRIAIPLLLAAASFMATSIGLNQLAVAQSPQPVPRVQLPRDRANPTLKKRAGQIREATGAQRNAQPPAGGTAPAKVETPPAETGNFRRLPRRSRVSFNLEDADLPELVQLISRLTGKRFILPGKVRSIKATVHAPTNVTISEAERAFMSLLEVNGLTLSKRGAYYVVEEATNSETRPLPLYTGNGATPSSDQIITRLHRISNVSAEDIATLLGRFKSAAGSVTAYAPTNTLDHH